MGWEWMVGALWSAEVGCERKGTVVVVFCTPKKAGLLTYSAQSVLIRSNMILNLTTYSNPLAKTLIAQKSQ